MLFNEIATADSKDEKIIQRNRDCRFDLKRDIRATFCPDSADLNGKNIDQNPQISQIPKNYSAKLQLNLRF